MKTVFIFGAGASKPAGAPLMYDFLDKADLLRRGNTLSKEQKGSFEDVFNALSELQGVYSKSYLDLDNLEILFGAIEMAQIIQKFGSRDNESIKKLRDSLVSLIVVTLEKSISFKQEHGILIPPKPYSTFSDSLLRVAQNRGKIPDVAYITFNYDLALDAALRCSRLGYSYYLDDPANESGAPLLKLHGSINWGACQECKKVIPWNLDGIQFNRGMNHEKIIADVGTGISNHRHCQKPLTYPPVLVPPTWNKTGYHKDLANVWKKAALELSLAENIIVIGYSLPETDSFFRYLFALGSESNLRLKRFWGFNPDESIKGRFEDMLGGHARTRFKFFGSDSGKFENSINLIEEVLGET